MVLKPAETVEVDEGKAAKIQCQMSGEPKPLVEWFKDEKKVKESNRIRVERSDETLSLNFTQTELDDEGEYKCVAHNALGSASTKAELLVNEPAKKPEFKEKMKNISVRAGDKAKFEVRVTGSPLPEVDWLKADQKLEDNGPFIMEEDEDGELFSLVIEDVKPENSGVYECVAFNEVGEVFCKGSLVVEEEVLIPPQFAKEEESAPLLIEEGDDVTLNVNLKKGQPTPVVQWFKDDELVEASSKVQVRPDGDRHSLVIKKAESDDSGVYKCQASNKAGYVARSFDVQITGMLHNAERSDDG